MTQACFILYMHFYILIIYHLSFKSAEFIQSWRGILWLKPDHFFHTDQQGKNIQRE